MLTDAWVEEVAGVLAEVLVIDLRADVVVDLGVEVLDGVNPNGLVAAMMTSLSFVMPAP